MSIKAKIQEEIDRLEAKRAELIDIHDRACNERTAEPGRSAEILRENWRREENRRDAVRAIRQSLDAAERQIIFLRSCL